MKSKMYDYIDRIKANKLLQRRIIALASALSVFVSSGVFWKLHGTGVAMVDDDVLCGLTEHSHTDECYESIPICGDDPDMDHVHDISCYKNTLICGFDEHKHSAQCLADISSDKETEADWENTLPELIENCWSENIAAVAESQLGYRESESNFTIADDGVTKKAYTRYGEWYNNPYGEDWNAMFTSFCMYYGGVPETVIPYGSGCWAWSVKLEEKGLIVPIGEEAPERGDIVLLDSDEDGKTDRFAIVIKADSESVTTIQGDIDGEVGEASYTWNDERITGYVSTDYRDMPAQEFSAVSESGIEVHASAVENVFPKNTIMVVTDISEEDALKAAAEGIGNDAGVLDAVAVDISFYTEDGESVEPAVSSGVQVRISLPEGKKLSGEDYLVLHQDNSGSVESVDKADVSENGASFAANEFSPYFIVSLDKSAKTALSDLKMGKFYIINGDDYIDPHPGESNEWDHKINPYTIYLGERIKVGILVNQAESNLIFNTAKNNNDNWSGWGDKTVIEIQNTASTNISNDTTLVMFDVVANGIGESRVYIDTAGSYQYREVCFTVQGYESNKIYVKTPTGVQPASNFSQENPYTIKVGESVEVFANLSNGVVWTVFDNDKDGGRKVVNRNGTTITGLTAGFTCQVVIGIDPWNNSNQKQIYDILYIQVISDPSSTVIEFQDDNGNSQTRQIGHFYVNTALGEKSKDEVHEGIIVTLPDGTELRYWEPNHKNQYRKNADNRNDRYWLSNNDDNVELAIYVPVSDIQSGYENNGYLTDTGIQELLSLNNNHLVISGGVKCDRLTGNDEYVKLSFTADTRNVTNLDGTSVVYKGSSCNETMFFEVLGENDYKNKDSVNGNLDNANHADIEVADGGKYRMVTYEPAELNGKKVYRKITRIYDVTVGGVNSSTIYYDEGKGFTVIPHEEYGRLNSSTEAGQNEFTSAYEVENGVAKEGNVKNRPEIVRSEVDEVVFDIDLQLTYYEGFSQIVDPETGALLDDDFDVTPSERVITRRNVQFTMDKRRIIDAVNKCPNHAGMDFTLNASIVEASLFAKKDLVGGDLESGEFKFGLYDKNGMLISISTNEADGYIFFYPVDYASSFEKVTNGNYPNIRYYKLKDGSFTTTAPTIETSDQYESMDVYRARAIQTSLLFDDEGDYEYTIRELPGSDDKIKYDTHIAKILIKVRLNKDNVLESSLEYGSYSEISDDEEYNDTVYYRLKGDRFTTIPPTQDTLSEYVNEKRYKYSQVDNCTQFINYVTFLLPETGGMGVIPYLAGGTAFIFTAFLLLIRRKKAERSI